MKIQPQWPFLSCTVNSHLFGLWQLDNSIAMATVRLLVIHSFDPIYYSIAWVIAGLKLGFWPFAGSCGDDNFPVTHHDCWVQPKTQHDKMFLEAQRDEEIRKGHFLPSFGPNLLPGMTSTPVFAVPKPHSKKLRLVSHQSYGAFSQNSLIDKALTKGSRLDTLKQLVPVLLSARKQMKSARLIMWKSDVAEAFWLMPMHPLWQLHQVVTTNIPVKDGNGDDVGELVRNVDHNATFGSSASPRLWSAIVGLVMWAAKHVAGIDDLNNYIDNVFSWDIAGDTTFYKKYQCYMPR
jgi:hypothetical protein